MPAEYNFLNLSPFDFELLSRDLLQKHLEMHIESFGSGADKGIDLRCFQKNKVIIQCKRFDDFNALYANLKKEVDKVKKLAPHRYIISTSVKMTPDRKDKIFKLFAPFIKNHNDIIGLEDLNNLLNIYPEIEQSHFKLWLSSFNILQQIVNRNIVNQSKFILEDIYNKIKIYVQNDSYSEGLDLLEKHRYIIISGIPGIGKTTLAEMLVYNLLAHDVEDFIYISDSIEQGYKLYEAGKSQVFLFDDFLGRNFLENTLKTNEEALILKFIERINSSKNKYMIIATREYILNQARLKYDLLDSGNFIKCVVDLSKYTKLAKAKILYNHLYFNNTPVEYVNELSNPKFLYQILEHPNYNPRIVETFTKSLKKEKINAKDYPLRIISLFDNPELVWKHAFEHTISQKSRCILLVFLMQGGSLQYEKLYELSVVFSDKFKNKYSVTYTSLSFQNSIKELQDSFISIQKDLKKNSIVAYQNPSIQDFLVNYLNADEILKIDLIETSVYIDQLLRLYSDILKNKKGNYLTITPAIGVVLENKIQTDFDNLLVLSQWQANWQGIDLTIYKLFLIVQNLSLNDKPQIKDFIINKVQENLYSLDIKISAYYLLELIDRLKEFLVIDIPKLLSHLVNVVEDSDDLLALSKLKYINGAAYQEFEEKNSDEFSNMIKKVVDTIIDDVSGSELEDTIELLKQIESEFNYDLYHELSNLEEKLEEYKQEQYEYDDDWMERRRSIETPENKIIDDLFKSYQ